MNGLRVVRRILKESDRVKRTPRRLNQSLRDFPTYTIPEASLYLAVPESTLRYWVSNHPVWRVAGAGPRVPLLSFRDVAQAYYVELVRTHFDLSLSTMRRVLNEAHKESKAEYPLLKSNIRVFLKHIIMDKPARGKQPRRMIDLTKHRQLGIPEVIEPLSTRIRWNTRGEPVQIFPWRFWSGKAEDETRPVSINPEVMSGRLVITGTRIPVNVVLQRNVAGESIPSLAKDYRLPEGSIRQALDHLVQKKAA